MKKILFYAVAAILLGTVTMLAPVMLLKSNYYGPLAFGNEKVVPAYCRCPRVEGETLDREQGLGRAICPSNLSSAGLMVVSSFLLALGVSIYFKKRIF